MHYLEISNQTYQWLRRKYVPTRHGDATHHTTLENEKREFGTPFTQKELDNLVLGKVAV